MTATLYSYWRSSAAYRVRLGLAYKGVQAQIEPVDLPGGAHRLPAFQALNPDGLVPLLEIDGLRLTQSMAILEYLEETHPQPSLLPSDPVGRARVRALAQWIACEIHPLNNLRTLQYLSKSLGVSSDQRSTWYDHWVRQGLERFERHLTEPQTGAFCHGDTPSMADCLLMPQVFNARIMKVDIADLQQITRVEANLLQLDWVRQAYPFSQIDAPADQGELALPAKRSV
jgi:maleylacetoacetate isomerase